MNDETRYRDPEDRIDGPRELPEKLFRQGDDWKWLKAARRERRRQEWKARLEALTSRENRFLVLAIAAPFVLLALAWMTGAVR